MNKSSIKMPDLHEVLTKLFDVTKYEAARNFDIAAWADQLTFRYHLFNMDNKQWDLVSLLFQMLETPLGKNPSRAGSTFDMPERLISSVNDLVFSDYFYAGIDLQAKNGAFADAIAACEKQNRSFDTPRDEHGSDEILTAEESRLISKSFDDLHLERLGKPYWTQRIDVDLDCSDETIIRDFKAWLAAKRKKLVEFHVPQKHPIGQKEFDSWIQVQFLPYLDVRMFCNWFGIHYKEISRKQYADLLFPIEKQDPNDETDRLETVRKTLHGTYFKKYFNSKFLTLMQQEARIQHGRRKPRLVE